jgi:hypothetical protein
VKDPIYQACQPKTFISHIPGLKLWEIADLGRFGGGAVSMLSLETQKLPIWPLRRTSDAFRA